MTALPTLSTELILKIIAMWTVGSIALGLIIAWIMDWALHYEPPEPPPLPSGSIQEQSFE